MRWARWTDVGVIAVQAVDAPYLTLTASTKILCERAEAQK
jgi:hypothetical protein